MRGKLTTRSKEETAVPMATMGALEIYYEKTSCPNQETATAGRRLLFIGGSGGDLRREPNVFGGPLASTFELLSYDQRGLGRSEIPDPPYTMAEYADDAAQLLDHIGWQTCCVMGVSFGGMVAQELAIRQPQRVQRLVLACTSSGGEGGATYPLHELAALSARERAERYVEIADLRHDVAWRNENRDRYERLIELAMSRATADDGRESDGARNQLEARRHHDTFARLGDIAAPTYLCGGRYDGIAPTANMEALSKQIVDRGGSGGSKLEFFEGGHLFLIQDRDAFPRIIAFLQED
jgi:3-oxoadipate enol-lactonase